MTNIRPLLPFAFAATLALGAPAFAEADPAMLARLKSFAAEQGTKIEWASTSETSNADGEDVTVLQDVTITNDGKPVKVAKIDLAAVEQEDGGWRIGSISVPSFSVTDDDSTADFTGMHIDGLLLPAEGKQADNTGMPSYSAVGFDQMAVQVKGKQVFTMSNLQVEVTPPEDGGPTEFTGAVEAFHADLEGVEDANTRAALEKMGYKQLDGSIEMEGSWDQTSGDLSLSKYDITVDNAGTFGISLDLGGYTPALLAQLKQIQQQMTANPEGDKSAAGMAMLGLMAQMNFQSARIEFTDDSLTGKALDYVASQQGAKPQDVANQAKALVPFAMMKLNSPALTEMVTKAVSDFLDNPGNIAIVAEPKQPVPLATIMAGAMSAPQMLPQQLGVTVLANE